MASADRKAAIDGLHAGLSGVTVGRLANAARQTEPRPGETGEPGPLAA
jgi:hypothetical protein